VTLVDVLALAFVALAALLGLRKGLLGSALSAAGIVAGAFVGGRLAPEVLAGGDASPYTPVVALAGAAVGALVLETAGTLLGGWLRRSLRLTPLRTIDSVGGLMAGAAAGLTLVWVLGAIALHLPGEAGLRQGAQRSLVLRHLTAAVPPDSVLRAIERVDPFPAVAGPIAPVERPDPASVRRPGVGRASASVVRVVGTACGLAVSGSGWVASPRLVVTAAHVVAGQRDTTVEVAGVDEPLAARAVAFDPRNDLAVMRLDRPLGIRPLPLASSAPGEPVAILGYPNDGPLSASAGRIGRTTLVLADDAYGRGPVTRKVTSLRGRVRHGNSGGPAVNTRGEVETTVFAARIGSEGGFGVPSDVVRSALARVGRIVSTRSCVGS